jgi:hypothetical protein
MFSRQKITHAAVVPRQYWIPPQWTEVIARLEAHGIEMTRLAAPQTQLTSMYQLFNPRWAPYPCEGRFPVTYEIGRRAHARSFPAGTVVVDMAQPGARIAANLLEPEAPDALAQWGFFDTIFETKEYVGSYVMEGIAREMLAKDKILARDFKNAMQDTSFANNPKNVINWFYGRSRYAETRIGEYPVVRIFNLGGVPGPAE